MKIGPGEYMKQFEIWVVDFDPTIGAEIKKTRPAVIVSSNFINGFLKTVIVVPFTTSPRYYPTRLATNFEKKGGEIALDQINSVDKRRLKKRIGMLDAEEAAAICQILNLMFSEDG